jgi:hypothetical protein
MERDRAHSSSVLIPPGISDADRLSRFRAKRAEWFELFGSDKSEVVSIEKQLINAVVLDLNYRVFVNESARHAKGEGYALPSLLYLLNVGYVTSQVLVARRLLDTRGDVASLSRILKDIKKNKGLITRENFICYDGTVYDPDIHKAIQNDEQKLQHTIFGLHAPGFSSHLRSYNRHKRFDSLSGKTETDRSRTDVIHENIFATLKRWLESPEAIRLKQISDNRFAHASDGSNATFKDSSNDLALLEVELAQRGFVRSSRAIFDVLLNSEIHAEVAPMIPLGSFGTVWKGSNLIPSTSRMQKDWDELANNRNSWGQGVDDQLFSESFATQGRQEPGR